MIKKGISGGTVHKLPADLRKILASSPAIRNVWEDITPLARNEWICWITSGKKSETRNTRIEKALSKLKGGMRRPCCWAGCMHRTDKTLSPSQKFILGKQSKRSNHGVRRHE